MPAASWLKMPCRCNCLMRYLTEADTTHVSSVGRRLASSYLDGGQGDSLVKACDGLSHGCRCFLERNDWRAFSGQVWLRLLAILVEHRRRLNLLPCQPCPGLYKSPSQTGEDNGCNGFAGWTRRSCSWEGFRIHSLFLSKVCLSWLSGCRLSRWRLWKIYIDPTPDHR